MIASKTTASEPSLRHAEEWDGKQQTARMSAVQDAFVPQLKIAACLYTHHKNQPKIRRTT